MGDRISERDLVLPALFCISRSGTITTSELSKQLRLLLRPQGEDVEILSGRNDDKFSQKVRNLRSHETLEKAGFATYSSSPKGGYWQITADGSEFLEANLPLLEYLLEQGFDYATQLETFAQVDTLKPTSTLQMFDEMVVEPDLRIVEGTKREVTQKIYERSAKLRTKAIEYYTVEGRISCHVCGFDFFATYGKHGEGFIEIHHAKPIFTYSEEDIDRTLEDALSNVVPLCSNCHQMIHRKRDRMLSVDELRNIYQLAVNSKDET